MSIATGLSQIERQDLEKFTKYFTLKSVQVIVQSRLGKKISTKSNPKLARSDWFNLAINDTPEITAESKKYVTNELPRPGYNLCVEISLRTADGECIVLEMWCIAMIDKPDPNIKVHLAVYNKMGLLLKSLIAVTRATPAYKLSRKQCAGEFGIFYRIYNGTVNVDLLGEGCQRVKIGSVPTPVGTITLSMSYRTILSSTERRIPSSQIMVAKDDHFNSSPVAKPTALQSVPAATVSSKPSPPRPQLSLGPSTPVFAASSPDHSSTPPPPAAHLQRQPYSQSPVAVQPDRMQPVFEGQQRLGAFASNTNLHQQVDDILPSDIPFSSLLDFANVSDNSGEKESTAKAEDYADKGTGPADLSQLSVRSCGSQHSGAGDDFVMVELKPAFATSNSSSDLGFFYREIQSAPKLSFHSEASTTSDLLNSCFNQLELYEEKAQEFDEFVQSLQGQDSDESAGSS